MVIIYKYLVIFSLLTKKIKFALIKKGFHCLNKTFSTMELVISKLKGVWQNESKNNDCCTLSSKWKFLLLINNFTILNFERLSRNVSKFLDVLSYFASSRCKRICSRVKKAFECSQVSIIIYFNIKYLYRKKNWAWSNCYNTKMLKRAYSWEIN